LDTVNLGRVRRNRVLLSSHCNGGYLIFNLGVKTRMKKLVSLLLCLLSAVAGLYAQSEVGGATLNGTITDPSGAAVAGARITAVDQGTGFARAAVSND